MQKTEKNTALAIFFLAASAVIGGLAAVIPVATTIPSAYADVTTCALIDGFAACATVGKDPELCSGLEINPDCRSISNREAAEESKSIRQFCEEGLPERCTREGHKP